MLFAEDWKFVKPGRSARRVIENRELWFSVPERFNDPFDCQVDIQGTFDSIADSLVVQHKEAIVGLVQGAKRHAESHQYGYFCACGTWDETLMWSHYAESHRGVAFGFSFAPDSPFEIQALTFKEIQYGAGTLGTALERSNEALNKQKAHPVSDPGLMQGEALEFFDLFRVNISDLYEAVRFMKAECWSYEQERRYELELLPEQKTGAARPFAPSDLKHVIFGIACSDETTREIFQLLAAPEWEHVQCWQAVRDAINLKIEVEKISRSVR